MEQVTATLPVRLVPRRRSKIYRLITSGVIFALSIAWICWVGFPGVLFGGPVALLAAYFVADAALKLLPNSPYFHLDLSVGGLTFRRLLKQQSISWCDLPQVTPLTESGIESSDTHYVVAVERLSLSSEAPRQREILRIPADDYGAKNSEQGVADLAAWLNRLRELALNKQLDAGTRIDVPQGISGNIIRGTAEQHSGERIGAE